MPGHNCSRVVSDWHFFFGGGEGAINYWDIVHLLKWSLEIYFDLIIYKDIMI